MRKDMTFGKRLRIAYHFVKGDFMKNPLILNCGICGSDDIRIVRKSENTVVHESTYKCNQCGCICIAKEQWF